MGSIDRNALYGKSQSLAVSDELLKYFLSSHLRGHITHLWRTSQLPLGGTAGFKDSFCSDGLGEYQSPWETNRRAGNPAKSPWVWVASRPPQNVRFSVPRFRVRCCEIVFGGQGCGPTSHVHYNGECGEQNCALPAILYRSCTQNPR